MNTSVSPRKGWQTFVALWPVITLFAAVLAFEFLFPDLLTRRYFHNIYIAEDFRLSFLIIFFLGSISGFDSHNRVRFSSLWVWFVTGALVAGAVADLLFADVIARFYLTSAVVIEFTGAILGVVIRPRFLAGLWRHIFDREVSWANRLFRLGLTAIPVAAAVFIAVCLYSSGAWRNVLAPHWRDWPFVVALAWGFAGGLFWPRWRQKQVLNLAS